MLSSACVVPSAPLLLPDLVPDDAEVAALRRTCIDAARAMVAAEPERIVVVGGPTAAIPVARFGKPSAGSRERCVGIALATWLLTAADWTGPLPEFVNADVEPHPSSTRDAVIDIGTPSQPMAVMVLADLSAAVGDTSPRPWNEAAVVYSDMIAEAVAAADIDALLAIEPEYARSMAIEGAAALREVASVAKGADIQATTLFRGAPFGVEYVVTVWQRHASIR